MYVSVLRLLRVFLLQRQAMRQNPTPEIAALLRESEKLDSGIYACLYQSVNCSADTVTDIVAPVLPLLRSLNHPTANSDPYFDPPSNANLLQKLNADILASKEVSRHYLRRVQLVVSVFGENDKECIRNIVLDNLQNLIQKYAQSTEIINENVMTYIQQSLTILSEMVLSADQIRLVFELVSSLMMMLNEHCPFIANYDEMVGIEQNEIVW